MWFSIICLTNPTRDNRLNVGINPSPLKIFVFVFVNHLITPRLAVFPEVYSTLTTPSSGKRRYYVDRTNGKRWTVVGTVLKWKSAVSSGIWIEHEFGCLVRRTRSRSVGRIFLLSRVLSNGECDHHLNWILTFRIILESERVHLTLLISIFFVIFPSVGTENWWAPAQATIWSLIRWRIWKQQVSILSICYILSRQFYNLMSKWGL